MYIDDLELNVVETGTGIKNPDESANIKVSPNPFTGSTIISFTNLSSPEIEIRIYNSCGALLLTDKENSSNQEIYSYEFDANDLPEGVYYCVVKNGNNTFVEKLIIIK